MNRKPQYDVIESEEGDETRDVVFAFPADLDDGSITHVKFVVEKIHEALQDTGTSCEDYVINTPLSEDEVKTILSGFGYELNTEIRDLMWG